MPEPKLTPEELGTAFEDICTIDNPYKVKQVRDHLAALEAEHSATLAAIREQLGKLGHDKHGCQRKFCIRCGDEQSSMIHQRMGQDDVISHEFEPLPCNCTLGEALKLAGGK